MKSIPDNFELRDIILFMVRTILDQEKTGRGIMNDMKNSGLILNQLEAEGYVRACLTIKNELMNYNEWLSNLVKEEDNEK